MGGDEGSLERVDKKKSRKDQDRKMKEGQLPVCRDEKQRGGDDQTVEKRGGGEQKMPMLKWTRRSVEKKR